MSSHASKPSLYPEVPRSNPESSSPFVSNPNPDPHPSSSSNLYPSLDMKDLVENLFPDHYGHDPSSRRHGGDPVGDDPWSPSAPPDSTEEVLIRVPGAILHLIDKEYSVELGCGDFSVVALRQGENAVVVLASVADEAQWPLTKDEATVKVDDSHYFFSLSAVDKTKSGSSSGSDSSDDEGKKRSGASDDPLNYGLTFASKGQEGLLRELDAILEKYSAFSIQKVSRKAQKGEALDVSVAKETSPAELELDGKKKEIMEDRCRAYWTTLAPNVEDYSGTAAKLIAAGSGQLIKGILWCGDVTVDRLNWGNEIMKKRLTPGEKAEIDKKTLKRLKRVKKMTRMTEKVALGVLSGVIRVSGYFTSSVANSTVGKKFFGLLPGEMVLASLDGFNKVCDAVEVAGRNVMATSSTVTTGLVSHRYGEEAGKATHEGLHAAGHAVGAAWAVFKIRKALNPKSVIKPSNIAKSTAKAAAKAAAAEAKAKSKKSK
ncbi:protein EARLY-RESPONSIVE TO DEHYDRATION 7, chloroplastic isoform X2 [Rhodamnia argentea]|uniref:Protein EARLY-RESPONSIVE TO DEHYDRATION 7, chloroplastic isoform X2 n=1 Tax=Rhodamnia argentea TaxID=178133 RepID=A0A8B8NNK5_9MYRT|nr:protein EARLY-RESPONSIVE TO DEHYDRATION 7, chloroplastic isoform X2 [Rhodamnia argentea]